MRQISLILFVGLAVACISAGCSNNPVTPDEFTGSSVSPSIRNCIGLRILEFDTSSGEVRVIPFRAGELHLNVTNILNSSMGVAAVGVPAEHDPANGIFTFDISLTHPFGTNQAVTGFDVKGILITPGTFTYNGYTFADTDETRLLNADGYTRWWNPSEFTTPGLFGYTKGVLANAETPVLTSSINPYKYFADCLYPEQNLSPVHGTPLDDDEGRGVFSAGATNIRRYTIKFPMSPGPVIRYGYAVDASWQEPSPNPPVDIPDDFPIEANEPEPYDVTLAVTGNTLYYDSETDNNGGFLRLAINIYDWQGQDAGDFENEITSVQVIAPELGLNGVDAVYSNETSLKARYRAGLAGIASPSEPGETILAVRAESAYGNYKQLAAAGPDEPVEAWNVTTIDVMDPECTGDANNDWIDAVEIPFGEYMEEQLCSPTDYRDFFWFEIPSGFAPTGNLVLWCDLDPCKLEIYNESQVLIAEEPIVDGVTWLDLEFLDLMPGKYYIRVYTSDDSFPCPYLIDFTGELLDVTPDNPVDVTPTGLSCNPEALLINGDSLYVSWNGALQSYDITNPASPEIIYEDQVFCFDAITSYGDYLYYVKAFDADSYRLMLLDISDPLNPVPYDTPVEFVGYQIDAIIMNSEHLYIGTDNLNIKTDIFIYDWASDPFNPLLVHQFDLPDMALVRFYLKDPEGPKTTLITAMDFDIYMHNVEITTCPTQYGHYVCSNFDDLEMHSDLLICCGAAMGIPDGIFILMYNQSIGVVPQNGLDTPGSARSVALDWPYAFVSDGNSGLTVVDVTNPMNPVFKTSLPLTSYADLVELKDYYAINAVSDVGLEVVDISDPLNPILEYTSNVLTHPISTVPSGNHLIIANGGDTCYTIKLLNISDPENAYLEDTFYNWPHKAGLISTRDDSVAVVMGYKDWSLIDYSDPMAITSLHTDSEANHISYAGFNGDLLYIANGSDLDIYDTDPLPPTHQNTVTLPNGPFWFVIRDDYMYITINNDVYTYSILDPINPLQVDIYASPGDARMLRTANDYLYVAENDRLEILDLSNPADPTLAGSAIVATNPFQAGYMSILNSGQFAVVGGLMQSSFVNLWPPDNPQLIGYLGDYNMGFGILHTEYQGYLYETTFFGGIRIYDLY